MQFVARWQTASGEEAHALDPGKRPFQRRGPISPFWPVQRFDDETRSLCFTKRQSCQRPEHTVTVNGFSNLSHVARGCEDLTTPCRRRSV